MQIVDVGRRPAPDGNKSQDVIVFGNHDHIFISYVDIVPITGELPFDGIAQEFLWQNLCIGISPTLNVEGRDAWEVNFCGLSNFQLVLVIQSMR